MGAINFRSAAGLFLVFLFLAQGTVGWIRFRYPYSRRVFLQQTSLERLQNCALKPDEECGICGEGPGELTTSSIAEGNYMTPTLTSDNVIDVQVAFRADLLGSFQFRLCNVGPDDVTSGRLCSSLTPLALSDGSRSYSPAPRQTSATIGVTMPEVAGCEKCVLQVKYRPTEDPDALGNHTYYDCAPIKLPVARSQPALLTDTADTSSRTGLATAVSGNNMEETSSTGTGESNLRVTNLDNFSQTEARPVISGNTMTNMQSQQGIDSNTKVSGISDVENFIGLDQGSVSGINVAGRTSILDTDSNVRVTSLDNIDSFPSDHTMSISRTQTGHGSNIDHGLTSTLGDTSFRGTGTGPSIAATLEDSSMRGSSINNRASLVLIGQTDRGQNVARLVVSEGSNRVDGGRFGAGTHETQTSSRAAVGGNTKSGEFADSVVVRNNFSSRIGVATGEDLNTLSGSSINTRNLQDVDATRVTLQENGSPNSLSDQTAAVTFLGGTMMAGSRNNVVSRGMMSDGSLNNQLAANSMSSVSRDSVAADQTMPTDAFNNGIDGGAMSTDFGNDLFSGGTFTTGSRNNVVGNRVTNTLVGTSVDGRLDAERPVSSFIPGNTMTSNTLTSNTITANSQQTGGNNVVTGGLFGTAGVGFDSLARDDLSGTGTTETSGNTRISSITTNRVVGRGPMNNIMDDNTRISNSFIAGSSGSIDTMSGRSAGNNVFDRTITRDMSRTDVLNTNLQADTVVMSTERGIENISSGTTITNSTINRTVSGDTATSSMADMFQVGGRFTDADPDTVVSNAAVTNTISGETIVADGPVGTVAISNIGGDTTQGVRTDIDNRLAAGPVSNIRQENTRITNSFITGGNTDTVLREGTVSAGSVETRVTGETRTGNIGIQDNRDLTGINNINIGRVSTGFQDNNLAGRMVTVKTSGRDMSGRLNTRLVTDGMTRDTISSGSDVFVDDSTWRGSSFDESMAGNTGRDTVRDFTQSNSILTDNAGSSQQIIESGTFVDVSGTVNIDNASVDPNVQTGSIDVGSSIARNSVGGTVVSDTDRTNVVDQTNAGDTNPVSDSTATDTINRIASDSMFTADSQVTSGLTQQTYDSGMSSSVGSNDNRLDANINGAVETTSVQVDRSNILRDNQILTNDNMMTGRDGATLMIAGSNSGSKNVDQNVLLRNDVNDNIMTGATDMSSGILGGSFAENSRVDDVRATFNQASDLPGGSAQRKVVNDRTVGSQRIISGMFPSGPLSNIAGLVSASNDNVGSSNRNGVRSLDVTGRRVTQIQRVSNRDSLADNNLIDRVRSDITDNLFSGARVAPSPRDISIRDFVGDRMMIGGAIITDVAHETMFPSTMRRDGFTANSRTNGIVSEDFTSSGSTGDFSANNVNIGLTGNTIIREQTITNPFDSNVQTISTNMMDGQNVSVGDAAVSTSTDAAVDNLAQSTININDWSRTRDTVVTNANAESNAFQDVLVGNVLSGNIMRDTQIAKIGTSMNGVGLVQNTETVDRSVDNLAVSGATASENINIAAPGNVVVDGSVQNENIIYDNKEIAGSNNNPNTMTYTMVDTVGINTANTGRIGNSDGVSDTNIANAGLTLDVDVVNNAGLTNTGRTVESVNVNTVDFMNSGSDVNIDGINNADRTVDTTGADVNIDTSVTLNETFKQNNNVMSNDAPDRNYTNIDTGIKIRQPQTIVRVPNSITVFPVNRVEPVTAAPLRPIQTEIRDRVTYPPLPSTQYNILPEVTTSNPRDFQSVTDYPTPATTAIPLQFGDPVTSTARAATISGGWDLPRTTTTDIPLRFDEPASSTYRTITARAGEVPTAATQNYDFGSYQSTQSPFLYDNHAGADQSRQDWTNRQISEQQVVELGSGIVSRDSSFTNKRDSSSNTAQAGLDNRQSTVEFKFPETLGFESGGRLATDAPIGTFDATTQPPAGLFDIVSTVATEAYDMRSQTDMPRAQDTLRNDTSNTNMVWDSTNTVRDETGISVMATDERNNVIVDTRDVSYGIEGTAGDVAGPSLREQPANLHSNIPVTNQAIPVYVETTTSTETPIVINERQNRDNQSLSSVSVDRNKTSVVSSKDTIDADTVHGSVIDYTLVNADSAKTTRPSGSSAPQDVQYMDLGSNVDSFGGVPIDNGQVSEPGSFFILSRTGSDRATSRLVDGGSFDVTNTLSSDGSLRDHPRSGIVVYDFADRETDGRSVSTTGKSNGVLESSVRTSSKDFTEQNQVIADIVRNGDSNVNRIRLNIENETTSAVINTAISQNTPPPIVNTNTVVKKVTAETTTIRGVTVGDSSTSFERQPINTVSGSRDTGTDVDRVMTWAKSPVATTVWSGMGMRRNGSVTANRLDTAVTGDIKDNIVTSSLNDPMTYHYFNLMQGADTPFLRAGQDTDFRRISSTSDTSNIPRSTQLLNSDVDVVRGDVRKESKLRNKSEQTKSETLNTNRSSSTMWDLNRMSEESVDTSKVANSTVTVVDKQATSINSASSTTRNSDTSSSISSDSSRYNTVNYRIEPQFVPVYIPETAFTGSVMQSSDSVISDQRAPDVMPPIDVNFVPADTARPGKPDINIRILQTLEELITELRQPDTLLPTEQNLPGSWVSDATLAVAADRNTVVNTVNAANEVVQDSNQLRPIVDTGMFYFTDSINKDIPPPIIAKDSVAGFNEVGTVKLANLKGVVEERGLFADTGSVHFATDNSTVRAFDDTVGASSSGSENMNINEMAQRGGNILEAGLHQPVILLPEQKGSMYQILMGNFANVSATKREQVVEDTANTRNREVLSTSESTRRDKSRRFDTDVRGTSTRMDRTNAAATPTPPPVWPAENLPTSDTADSVLNKIRSQMVIQATDGQIKNPFAGTDIPLHNMTDKLGNIIAMEPQYRSASLDATLDQTTSSQANAGSDPVSIEGKYYIGEMRRNVYGQFEPVPVGADLLSEGNRLDQMSPLQQEAMILSNTLTSSNAGSIDRVRPTVYINIPLDTGSTGSVSSDSQHSQRINSESGFISQDNLLDLIKQQQGVTNINADIIRVVDEPVRVHVAPITLPDSRVTLADTLSPRPRAPAPTCQPGERFVCSGVGSYQAVPGMVWWCFSHCKNGVCPPEKCDCNCEPSRLTNPIRGVNLPAARETSQTTSIKTVENPPSARNSQPRVKKIINLTLNGSEESLIRVGEGFSANSEKILQPRTHDVVSSSSSGSNRLGLNTSVLKKGSTRSVLSGGSSRVRTSARTKAGIVCRGINAFEGTTGMDEWCTTMCRRDVCPAEICAC